MNVSSNADNKYFVFEGHTLGFIRQAEKPDYSTPLAGELDWRNGGFHLVASEVANLRTATEADFAHYRVSLPPDFLQVEERKTPRTTGGMEL